MKKKYNFGLSLFALLLMELLYFLWQPYPKSILKTVGSPWAYSDIITGIIYFLILAVVIDISVRSMARLRELSSFFEWKNTKYIAAMMAAQLCLDLVKLAGARLLNEYAAIAYDVLTVVGWVLFALIFSRMTERWKDCRRWERIMAAIPVAVLLLCVLLDIGDIVQRHALLEKYKLASQMLESRFINIQYRFEVRNMLLDFCCGAAFLAYFLLEGEEEKRKKYDEGWRLISRMTVLLVVCAIVYFAKALILPNNTIFPGFIQHSGVYSTYRLAEPEYDITNADEFNVYRFNWEREKKSVYCVSDDTIWYNGNDLFNFKTDGSSGFSRHLAERIEYNSFELIQIGDTDAAIYASKEIVWMIGNEATHISFEDIASAKENSVLTALCLERIAAGDWRFFEYGYEYLLKYEPDFIIPYIERYAAGEFTDSEIEYSYDYNQEYIQKIAMAALGCYKYSDKG